MTAPGVILLISSLGIVVLFGLGPGKNEVLFCLLLFSPLYIGPIPWVMVAELFNQETRSMGVSIATLVNWVCNFIVGLVFPFILVGSN